MMIELDLMFRPITAIFFGGIASSALVSNAITDITITDEIGTESDSCEITLDDRSFILPEFKPSIEIAPILGYIGGVPLYMGKFALETIREKEDSSGCTISLSAKAADLVNGGLKYPKDGYFRDKTVGEIADEVAGRNNLKAFVDKNLRDIPIHHLTQKAQSDMDFMSRLAKQYGATFTIKENQLILKPPYNGQSASGAKLTAIIIARGEYENLTFTSSKRSETQGVTASSWDQKKAKRIKTTIGDEKESFHIKGNFENEQQAKAAAAAAFVRGHSAKRDLQITMKGNTAFRAGFPVMMKHPKARIAGLWIIKKARHSFNKSKGYICQLTLKAPEEVAKEFLKKQKAKS